MRDLYSPPRAIEPDTHSEAAPSKPRKAIPGVGIAILLMLIFWGISGTVGVAVGIVLAATGSSQGAAATAIAGLGNLIAALAVLAIGKAWSRKPYRRIMPFTAFPSASILALLLVGAGLSVLMSEADNLLRFFVPMPGWLREMMAGLVENGPASFFVLVIIAPLTEEPLFRGLIMQGFLGRYSPGKAVVLSALLFAVFHLNPYQMANAFVLGLVLGWLRLRTGSLWPPIILHAISNGIVFVAGLLPLEIPGYTRMEVHSFQPWWLDLGGFLVAAAGLVLMKMTVARGASRT